ncbi:MAG: TolC family protein, partial [Cyclobacteriaceae bacterium]|nr:TolC family protein [Cyclobacteriaceae bacterium]
MMEIRINCLKKYGWSSLTLAFLFLLPTFKVQSQEIQPINLETVLKLGGANNLTIQEYKQRQELALANLSKTKEWWLPNVYAGIQTNQLWGASMNSDG